jgi:hypothetical protein
MSGFGNVNKPTLELSKTTGADWFSCAGRITVDAREKD